MSSRLLLVLLNGMPEDSEFKKASERGVRIVKYVGDDPNLKGKTLQMSAVGRPHPEVEVLAEFIDWTHDKKIQARMVRELAALRPEPDFTGVLEPLDAYLLEIARAEEAAQIKRGTDHILSGLYGNSSERWW